MPLSRKYRPQLFKDVTGQQHITETLRNEVETGTLGHAFLFSGPRGVGKTTTARIFAKALLNEKTNHGEPDLESEASHQVDQGNCIDFIEIDAASHTGVDHVREVIIDHVRFAPARWKRKVYVIDECHMLSTSAWNALLKTLEEPPEYAFFILATTELHKVPETIKSRCQRFEFKRIQPDALGERIRMLAKEESLTIDDEVVHRIVHASDGCLRDAESLMDQLISLGSSKITSELATLVLPVSMLPRASELLALASRRDVDGCLARAKQFLEEGMSSLEILQDLLEAVRMLIRAQESSELLRLQNGDEGDKAIAGLAGIFSLGELAEIALMLLERRRDCKMGTDPMFALELALCAIAGGLLHGNQGITMNSESKKPPSSPVYEKKAEIKTNVGEESREAGGGSREVMPVNLELERQGNVVADVEVLKTDTDSDQIAGSSSSVTIEEIAPSQQDIPKPSYAGATDFDIHDIRKYWSIIIREVEKVNHSLPFILKVSQPDKIEGVTVHIRFQYPFHREKLLEDMKTRRIVEEAIRTVMKNDRILIDGFCNGKIEQGVDSLENAPIDVVSRVLGAFGGQVIE